MFMCVHVCMCLRVIGSCVSLGTPVYTPFYVFVSLCAVSTSVCERVGHSAPVPVCLCCVYLHVCLSLCDLS